MPHVYITFTPSLEQKALNIYCGPKIPPERPTYWYYILIHVDFAEVVMRLFKSGGSEAFITSVLFNKRRDPCPQRNPISSGL